MADQMKKSISTASSDTGSLHGAHFSIKLPHDGIGGHEAIPSDKQDRFNTPKIRDKGIALACLLIMATISLFCSMTPWVYDDFGYGSGDSSLSSIFAAQVNEHMMWSGKFVGHFMSRVLLHGPVWLHPTLTPVIFMGLIFSGVLLALGIQWREKLQAWHLVTLAGLTWFALPAFGTVYFWRTGTPDYGYSLAFATAFLLPYRLWVDRADYRMPGGPIYALAGFLAGCSNENVGMLVILTALGVIIFRFRTERRLPLWAAAGIAGAATGWTLMMTAPGNAVRLAKIGGVEKIPAMSLESFNRFLTFWGSQQLEMLPYFLAALGMAWALHRSDRLRPTAWLPGIVFFLMAQASLAAFVFSPSTPYRAMSATFFYAALCCFSFLAAWSPKGIKATAAYATFCVVLLSSVLAEVRVFNMAQPALAARNLALGLGPVTVRVYDYPKTDKYFFPGYDIREIDLYGTKWRSMVPWDETTPLNISGAENVRALIVCNVIYLENLPASKVHVAAVAHKPNVASLMQAALRGVSPLTAPEVTTMSAITTRYVPSFANVTDDGKAAVYIGGIASLDDIAYVAFEQTGKPLIWRRAGAQKANR
jgi:hypothetical protein